MTENRPFVRMGFSVKDHFDQASITRALNSCNIKLAVTQLVTFSTWMRKRSRNPSKENVLWAATAKKPPKKTHTLGVL